MAKKKTKVIKKSAKITGKKPVKVAVKKPVKKPAKVKVAAPAKPKGVSAVPVGFHTVTPHLVIRGAAQAIAFYQKAFGAVEVLRMPGPDGTLHHADIMLGDSHLFLCDEFPGMNKSPQAIAGTPVTITMYVPDCDAVFNQAVASGAKVRMPPMDMFWGDRYAKLEDPFGHEWALATHTEDVSHEEMAKRMESAMAHMAPPPSHETPRPSNDGPGVGNEMSAPSCDVPSRPPF